MAKSNEKGDKTFPLFANDNPLRRLFAPPRRLIKPYVRKGQTAADLGCGPGFYTIPLAELVSPEGNVYAVDVDERAICELERRAAERGCRNIEARASSAANLNFIGDASVDFVLCHGLLCSMAPKQHEAAVGEIKRILKPDGLAYISVARGPWSYMGKREWEEILAGFEVRRRGDGWPAISDRWAVVSRKQSSTSLSLQ